MMNARPDLSAHARRVAHPEIAAHIRKVVRRFPRQKREDVGQKIYCRLLVTRDPPEDLAGLKGLAMVVADGLYANSCRHADAVAKVQGPPCEDPDVYVADEGPPSGMCVIDAKKKAEIVLKAIAEGRVDAKVVGWALELDEGSVSSPEIAEREGKCESAVRTAILRARQVLQRDWEKYSDVRLFLLFLVVLAAILARYFPQNNVADPHKNDDSHINAPSPPHAPTGMERAKDLRDKAFAACSAGAWQPCFDGLKEARALDPEGDAAPEVQRAWVDASSGILQSKPPSTESSLKVPPPGRGGR
jgi:DNA-directed RNA polymerase specialized sigma24 family protein